MGTKWKNIDTAEGLIRKAGRETKKKIELLNSDKFFCNNFENIEPRLAIAAKEYITCIKRLKNIETDGWLKSFKDTSRNLIQAFDFADNNFFVDAHGTGIKHPIYCILETVFCGSLFREEGLQRRFKNLYNISKNITNLNKNEYFLYAVPYIYYVNACTGSILRCTKKIDNFEQFIVNGSDVWYNSNDMICENGEISGEWTDATYSKRSGGKSGTVYKNITFSSKNYIDEYGGKGFTIPAHQIIMLCYYGLDIMKHCIGSGSLLCVHHILNSDNSVMNLAITTRVGNSRESKTGTEPINFLQLFEILQLATTPYEYHKKYFT